MSRKPRSKPPAPRAHPQSQADRAPQVVSERHPKGRRRVRLSITVLGAVAIVLLPLFGWRVLAWGARQQATRQLERGAISQAQRSLDWALWLAPRDGRVDLLRAACFRQLQEVDRFTDALADARQKGAPADHIENELRLGQLHAGRLSNRADAELNALIEAGVPANDVAAALIAALLIRDEPEQAHKVLQAWAADLPGEPEVAYMRGVYWHWMSEHQQAHTALETALALEPRHELARRLLAESYEEHGQLQDAYQQYHRWAMYAPGHDSPRVGLARQLRQLGHFDQARTILEPLASVAEPTPIVVIEMAQLELDCGRSDEALQWFRRVPAEEYADRDLAADAAMAIALSGRGLLAARLLSAVDTDLDRQRRIAQRQGDAEAAPQAEPAARPADVRSFLAAAERPVGEHATAAELYAIHCSACHGARGDGNGPAAASLFPRAANLRTGRFKLASTRNAVASADDVAETIRRGIAGTAMPPLGHLGEEVIVLLAQETLRLRREGAEQLMQARFADQMDEEGIESLVDQQTVPGDVVAVPAIGPVTAESAGRGREVYFRLGCQQCHGEDGSGAPQGPMYDPQDQLAPPRDLVRDPFKGGHDAQAIYRRLWIGMHGTLHPGSPDLPDDQLTDLVQYIRTLSREPKRNETNHQRLQRALQRVHAGGNGD